MQIRYHYDKFKQFYHRILFYYEKINYYSMLFLKSYWA